MVTQIVDFGWSDKSRDYKGFVKIHKIVWILEGFGFLASSLQIKLSTTWDLVNEEWNVTTHLTWWRAVSFCRILLLFPLNFPACSQEKCVPTLNSWN